MQIMYNDCVENRLKSKQERRTRSFSEDDSAVIANIAKDTLLRWVQRFD
jgi:hypothetical protein